MKKFKIIFVSIASVVAVHSNAQWIGNATSVSTVDLYTSTKLGIGFTSASGAVAPLHVKSTSGTWAAAFQAGSVVIGSVTGSVSAGVPLHLNGGATTANDFKLRIGSYMGAPGADYIEIGMLKQVSGQDNVFSINATSSSTNNTFAFSTYNMKKISFQVGSTENMFILKTGEVGIGAQSDFTQGFPAGYGFYVSKGILSEKVKCAVKTTTNWADHVFEPSYKLKSIGEIEAFIKTNRHLPGIPSAEEVVKEGVDMVGMDAKLLEKIEELTLYAIDMKKENDRLQEENKKIIGRLEALEKSLSTNK